MTTIDGSSIRKLIVARDAGMGSSGMLAGQLKQQLKKTGVVEAIQDRTSVEA
jgi:mannitol-specific phosphotransferase system IIBC component